jgi:uncharacterized protein (DUF433 family)
MGAAKVYRDLIWIDPERVSGMPCFYGTRVPVAHLFDYLEGGYSIEGFAEEFVLPVEQVRGVLEASKAGLWRELEVA